MLQNIKTQFTASLTYLIVIGSLLSLPFSTQAIWFEATGQAVIYNDNKQQARQQATQEAISQALMFAGASVSSVQHMANGLLQDDRFEVRATGEVNKIELIDEFYADDVVTISIRADIFPQQTQCKAADYKKNIVTGWYPIQHQQQATTGSIFALGETVPNMLQAELKNYGQHAYVKYISPNYMPPKGISGKQALMQLARQHASQFVLLAEIKDVSVETTDGNVLKFWQDLTPKRHFSLHFNLIDATSGASILENTLGNIADWNFDLHREVDTKSQKFWQSNYGNNIKQILQQVAQELDETVSCIPAYGRIIQAQNETISVDIGKMDGVKMGDRLQIFQMQQYFDSMGKPVYQYKIHPIEVEVFQVFARNAQLRPIGNQPLANIQANDYVVRR